MAEFVNTTLIYPGEIKQFASGFLFNGTYQNGTIFNGPGLIHFLPEPFPTGDFIGLIAGFTLICLIFSAGATLEGHRRGQRETLEELVKCTDDQARMDYVNNTLKFHSRETKIKFPFELWPGEQKSIDEEKYVEEKCIKKEKCIEEIV